jgi:hypothetical protein
MVSRARVMPPRLDISTTFIRQTLVFVEQQASQKAVVLNNTEFAEKCGLENSVTTEKAHKSQSVSADLRTSIDH